MVEQTAPESTPTTPIRIQRMRLKGWRKPSSAVYVGRPTVFANPFRVGDTYWVRGSDEWHEWTIVDRAMAARAFSLWLTSEQPGGWQFGRERHHLLAMLPELRGKNLMCWCPLDDWCHADVLLDLANREVPCAREV